MIEDDGRGFDLALTESEIARKCLGLLGMHERISLSGGTLAIESGPGMGAMVHARIPLAKTPDDELRPGESCQSA